MTPKYTGPRVVRRCVRCGWISSPAKTPALGAYALRKHSCAKFRAEQERARKAAEREAAIDRTPKPCAHKQAQHQHGTYACYTLDSCRCLPCATARSEHQTRVDKAKAYGRYDRYVDAEPVREHVRSLQAAGMGLKTISAQPGISHGALWKLMYGKRRTDGTREPSNRVLRTTADRILAIEPVAADGARVDQTGTTRRLQALMAIGWSASRLGERVGILGSNMSDLIHGRRQVTGATRKTIADLYEQFWDQPPPNVEWRDKISVSRTKRFAERNGWAPPLAWDDIDDPEAAPFIGEPEKVTKQDRILDLIDLGEPLSIITQRCAVTPSDVQIVLRRTGRTDDWHRLRGAAA